MVLLGVVTLMPSVMWISSAASAPGDLDTTFDRDGIVITQAGDPACAFQTSDATAMAIQTDGKIVVAGNASDADGNRVFAVARYLVDGRLDRSFGRDGIVRAPVSDPAAQRQDSSARAVAIQPDGKIVVAGQAIDANSRGNFAVVRYRDDGRLDTTFGRDGVVITEAVDPASPRHTSEARDVAIQADGKIVVAGECQHEEELEFGGGGAAMVRYQVNGQLDRTFGRNGVVITREASSQGLPLIGASDMAIQANGKIVVAGGFETFNEFVTGLYVARYLVDGRLDRTFGRDGIVTTDVPDQSEIERSTTAEAVAIQADGNILVAGSVGAGRGNSFVVLRYEGGTSRRQSCDCEDPMAIIGSHRHDVLVGTSGADIICGLGGNDRLLGLEGDDCLDGGAGNDRLLGGFGHDILIGDEGHDLLRGGHDDDLLLGGNGDDELRGGGGRDTCDGGAGTDTAFFCRDILEVP